jgi:hypothetical protein
VDLGTFAAANACRFSQGSARSHYESYFVRANHPTEPSAFWFRYTIFSPRGRPQGTVGELWAIYFDGVAGRIDAHKRVVPFDACSFDRSCLDVAVGSARLTRRSATGEIAGAIGWELDLEPLDERPVLLLPAGLYDPPVPRAKSVTPAPFVRFTGRVTTSGRPVAIDGWMGSQSHNWGSAHTDRYAWGQVVGFDDAPSAYLECATARYRVGGLWTPPLTTAVLRLDGEELRFNTVAQAISADATLEETRWVFVTGGGALRARATFSAPKEAFVGLTYDNPPGGRKTCQNSKLARCEVELWRRGAPYRRLVTQSRAAFEVLSDEPPRWLRVAV